MPKLTRSEVARKAQLLASFKTSEASPQLQPAQPTSEPDQLPAPVVKKPASVSSYHKELVPVDEYDVRPQPFLAFAEEISDQYTVHLPPQELVPPKLQTSHRRTAPDAGLVQLQGMGLNQTCKRLAADDAVYQCLVPGIGLAYRFSPDFEDKVIRLPLDCAPHLPLHPTAHVLTQLKYPPLMEQITVDQPQNLTAPLSVCTSRCSPPYLLPISESLTLRVVRRIWTVVALCSPSA